jgi:hypothetical protein
MVIGGWSVWKIRFQLLGLLLREFVLARKPPPMEYVQANHPDARLQYVSGVYADVVDQASWTGQCARIVLKKPRTSKALMIDIHLPPEAVARQVTVLLDGRTVITQAVEPGHKYIFQSAGPVSGANVEIRVDRTFRPPGDLRDLGIVLLGLGFVE